MVDYKLYYFPARGRGEVVRLIFAYFDVKYEDIRIPGTEWPKHKSEMPMEQMPCLEVNGEKFGQSGPIFRYLAREYGLSGKDSKEEYYIDMLCSCFDDVAMKYPREQDETKKAELMKVFIGTTVPEMMKKIEKIIGNIPGKNGFFVSKLSIADLAVLTYGDFLLPLNCEIFSGTPKLKALYENAKAIPKIAAWIEKRPKSEF